MRVTSKQADKLKELGYNGVVDRVYLNSAKEPDKIHPKFKQEELAPGHYKNGSSSWVAAPTVLQVIQWLILVKKLFPIVAPTHDEIDESESQILWTAGVYDIDLNSETSILTETHEYYHTHDEALLDAINLAIELTTTLKR